MMTRPPDGAVCEQVRRAPSVGLGLNEIDQILTKKLIVS